LICKTTFKQEFEKNDILMKKYVALTVPELYKKQFSPNNIQLLCHTGDYEKESISNNIKTS